MSQRSFHEGGFERHRKTTGWEIPHEETDRVISWQELCAVIEPFYPKPKGAGRRPVGLERRLWIRFRQHCFNLSGPAMVEAACDYRAMRLFIGIDLGEAPVPDKTTILKFRHLLEARNLVEKPFQLIIEYLEANGLKMSQGIMVDATIISALIRPGSGTRNGTRRCTRRKRETNGISA